MNDETDIVATLLRRAEDGDEVCGVAAAEIRRLRGIAGRDARITRQSRDLLAGRRALNPRMKIRTHGLPVHEKIKARTVVDEKTGCWVWQGNCCNGYGRLRSVNGGKGIICHRYMYQHHHGPIPEGHVVMHTCDNRRCVNPDHLKAGTQQENVRDMHAKNRSTRAVLTPDDVRAIRVRRSEGHGIDKIAAEFGIGTFTVQKIIKGLSWSWVV